MCHAAKQNKHTPKKTKKSKDKYSKIKHVPIINNIKSKCFVIQVHFLFCSLPTEYNLKLILKMSLLLTNLHHGKSPSSLEPLGEEAVTGLHSFSSCALPADPRGLISLAGGSSGLVLPDRSPSLLSRFWRSSAGGDKQNQTRLD